MNARGLLIIISGPSGSGKGTVVKKLGESASFSLSISLTTRPKRPSEEEGQDYFFCTMGEFLKRRNNNELLEHAEFCGNCYGTPKYYVDEQISKGKYVILEIDVNGALQVKDKFQDCILIFLMPPSINELKSRLINRNTEDSNTILKRLRQAREEIKLVERYDYLVVNDSVDNSVNDIVKIVAAEGLRPKRNIEKINYFKEN